MLEHCLRGLLASDLVRSSWELIVVDDGSTDGATAAVAHDHGAHVVRIDDGPKGPAFARNCGVEHARCGIAVFVDADVVVDPKTLSQFLDAFTLAPDVDAIFGSYDSSPGDSGFVSQYRNLLHHWVHHREAGNATTFWAGCGAVRTHAFLAVGGFDAHRFRRPQIEDIDLGYRLSDHGFQIVLEPRIQGTHLKRWTLRTMLRADLFDRAIPWMQLLRTRGNLRMDGPLNLRVFEKVLTALTSLGIVLLMAAIWVHRPALLVTGIACLLAVVFANAPLFRWFARVRGPLFALRTIPLRLFYYVVCAVGGSIGLCTPARVERDARKPSLFERRALPSSAGEP